MNIYVLIAIGVIVIALAVLFIIKKYVGKSTVNTIAQITEFIKSTLISLGITTEDSKFDNYLEYADKALTYIASICDSSVATAAKVTQAIAYIKEISATAKVEFTDSDYETFATILTAGFNLITALGIKMEESEKMYKKVCAIRAA